jgi:hypothetical protein
MAAVRSCLLMEAAGCESIETAQERAFSTT